MSVIIIVEDKIVECFTELVVKMSENVFRPVFLKVQTMHHVMSCDLSYFTDIRLGHSEQGQGSHDLFLSFN